MMQDINTQHLYVYFYAHRPARLSRNLT